MTNPRLCRISTAALLVAIAAHADAAPDTVASKELEKPRAPDKPAPVAGEDEQLYSCKPGNRPVVVTFKPETELKDLITWAVSFTCKGFILDPRVVLTGKKVTLIVPTQLSPADAYRVFLAALATAGVTVVPKGKVLRIVDAGSAKKDTVPLLKKGLPDDIDQFVRYVYRPSYVQAETIRNAFMSMKSEPGDVLAVGSMIVITDYASNVRDMMSLAKMIDMPGGTDGVYTIPLRHADVTKLAPKLEAFLGVTAQGAPPAAASRPRPDGVPSPAPAATDVATAVPSKIMVDERTNTLVVASSEAAYLRLRAIVDRLDIALEIEGGATFHVYPLGHAIAEELAATLNQAITGAAPPQRTQPGTPGAPTPRTPTPAPAPPTAETGSALEGPVRVIGEKATNALIVMSSGRDFLAIRDIIRQLDLPRRQVYIEALIIDVGVGDGLAIGGSAHAATKRNDAVILGGVQNGLSTVTEDAIKGSATSLSGLIGGVIGPIVNTTLGVSIPSYAVLFEAAATASRANVLSAPSIIAIDNEEAKYKVGTSIPFKRGITYQPVGGTSVPTDQIDPRDVLLELSIKPHISKDESILLEVKHDAEDVISYDQKLGPTISKRSFDTRVVVRDQQTVVIGGLMQERATRETTKVPIIGDIPLLGRLFKYERTTKKKTNLLIMLTPYIIKDQLDLQMLRDRKVREHDEFVGSLRALSSMPYVQKMDYRRKRGLVEEINRVSQDIDADIEARKALREPATVTPGRIEYAPSTEP